MPVVCRDRKKALPNARWRNQDLADLRARATATTSMAGTRWGDRLSEAAEAVHTRREGSD